MCLQQRQRSRKRQELIGMRPSGVTRSSIRRFLAFLFFLKIVVFSKFASEFYWFFSRLNLPPRLFKKWSKMETAEQNWKKKYSIFANPYFSQNTTFCYHFNWISRFSICSTALSIPWLIFFFFEGPILSEIWAYRRKKQNFGERDESISDVRFDSAFDVRGPDFLNDDHVFR